MMNIADWCVIGGGITGSALAYELARQGLSVTLLERHEQLQGGTRFGYGGVAYWSGTTDLTRQLCAEGKERLRSLTDELGADIQFRELDLVLTIAAESDPQTVAQAYAHFAIPPQLVGVQEACELEPLLNPAAIAGALTVKHGHIHLGLAATAYQQALRRQGGTLEIATAIAIKPHPDQQHVEVVCQQTSFHAKNVVVCAGALSRALLRQSGISVPLYFTHAELIETPPVDLSLRSLVMPAETQRFAMEATASRAESDALWDTDGHELSPPILDPGAIQFLDGSLRIGQTSRTLTNPAAPIDAPQSEQEIRDQVGHILPALKDVPGTWHRCLVAFSRDRLPLVGPLQDLPGVHLFSGFSNPLAITTPLAKRFAQVAIGNNDDLLSELSPHRFQNSLA